MSARTICALISSGRKSISEPFIARPIGLRAVATMTASGITTPVCDAAPNGHLHNLPIGKVVLQAGLWLTGDHPLHLFYLQRIMQVNEPGVRLQPPRSCPHSDGYPIPQVTCVSTRNVDSFDSQIVQVLLGGIKLTAIRHIRFCINKKSELM